MLRKITKIILAVFVSALIFSNVSVFSYSAKALALCEVSTGTFLETVNGDSRLPMASTTKIMTALVVLENADLSAEIKIPSVAVGIEGSSMYLVKDEPLTVEELLMGLMLTSGNDASVALAHYVGNGKVENFVKLMNQKAEKLGLSDTNFTNPSGLPDDNHYTTAKELAKITVCALNNPVFSKIVSMKSAKIRYNGIENGRTLKNHNKLLSMYDDAVGVKTGFTKKAGRCLVGAAKRDGVTLVCVTLNDPDDWDDHITAFEKGFCRVKKIALAKKDSIKVQLKTPDGMTFFAKNNADLYAVVTDGKMPSQTILCDETVYAPKKSGDIVGTVVYTIDGKEVASSPLYITQDIEAPFKKELFITRIIKFIRNMF